MNYLLDLTKEELKYICSEIPFQESVDYFRRYPKEFTKLRPGFRVKSLTQTDVIKTLYGFRNRDYIASFIVKHINRWIVEIEEELSHKINEGMDTEMAYIDVLSRSFFAKNVPLYFKIKEEEKTKEYLEVLGVAISYQYNNQETIEKERCAHYKELAEKDKIIKTARRDAEESAKTIDDLRKRIVEMKITIESYIANSDDKQREITDLSNKIKQLKHDLKKKGEQEEKKEKDINIEISALNSMIEKLSSEKQICLQTICHLKDTLKKEREEVKTQVIQSEPEQKEDNSSDVNMPLRPDDMDEFEEYFVYNLNNIGFDKSSEMFNSFVTYLKGIVFEGIPLLIKHAPGINLANCIANTLYGQSKAVLLPYSESISSNEIKDFLLTTSDRVVCLDGFIGNCNEIEMIPLLEQFRNKIIFVTYMYDRTLKYIPAEILTYFNYLNVDEIKPLVRIKDVTEDPSDIHESTYAVQENASSDNRYGRIFSEIAAEFGFHKDVISVMANGINEEESMNNILIYTLLPYVSNVLQRNPYSCSKRLQKYAGESGKCPKKEMIMRWFG
ncbi:MAG: hypothetical protein K2O02_02530 [Lachnospiraceae bacterium]|nr:hypothetical protein [Lachnospiraceae bacterium]